MLSMNLAWVRRNEKYLLILLGIIIAAAVLLFLNSQRPIKPKNSTAISNQELYKTQKAQAVKTLAQKDYAQAQQNYIAAATEQQVQGDLNGAIVTLQQGEAKIPGEDITWDYYDVLAAIAKKAGNKKVEVSAIKAALPKAQAPNSGAPASVIVVYNNRLKELGAQ